MVEERREAQRARFGIAEHFQVGAMAVAVQYQEIDGDAFPDLFAPAHAHAEVERAFTWFALQLIERVERNLALAWTFEILACVEPGFEFSSADSYVGVDEPVAQVLYSEYLQKAVDDDLVDAFMPDDSVLGVII